MSAPVSYKIVVFGEPGVGKTCFIDQFCYGKSFVAYDPNNSNLSHKIDVDGRVAHLSLMDLSTSFLKPEQSMHHTDWAKKMLAEADGVVLLYDVTSLESYESLIDQARKFLWHCRELIWVQGDLADRDERKGFGCVLVGNKHDLVASDRARRAVSRDEADEWASSQGFRSVEMDSLAGAGPSSALQLLMKNIWKLEKLGLMELKAEEKEDEGQTSQGWRSGSIRSTLRKITQSSQP